MATLRRIRVGPPSHAWRVLLIALLGSAALLGSFRWAAPADVATGTVSGTVRDGDGNPLKQVMIIILNRQLGGFTDSTGSFTVRRVPVGTFTMRASQYPFRNTDVENVKVSADSTTHVDFVLTRPEDDAPVFTGAYIGGDKPYGGDPEKESLVQIGVRFEKRDGKRVFRYKVLNRSPLALTEIRVGYDAPHGHCELTGKGSHAVPDTAFGPPGWVCVPVQGEDPETFALSWKAPPDREGGAIPPSSSSSDFIVTIHGSDAQYENCHWLAFTADEQEGFAGRVRPGREVDAIPMTTGTITGKVMGQNGAPLPRATVRLSNAGLSTEADSNGIYAIAVPTGVYTVMAGAADYQGSWKNDVRVEANRGSRADFHLSPQALLIPCTAYTTARDRMDVPFPSDVIDTHDARFLNRGEAVPPKRPGERPRPYIYSLTNRDIEVVYRGLGEDTLARAFVAQIHREFRGPEEERLLRIAEEVYPPTKAVVSLADDRLDRKALLHEKRLWWYGEFDDVRLPYAVTMDAVRYYLDLTQTFGMGDRTKPGGFRMLGTDFSYSAHISPGPQTFKRHGETFEDVYVVEMKLIWSNYCGNLCACSFSLDRTVLLRANGTLVCVFGDRRPMVTVS